MHIGVLQLRTQIYLFHPCQERTYRLGPQEIIILYSESKAPTKLRDFKHWLPYTKQHCRQHIGSSINPMTHT